MKNLSIRQIKCLITLILSVFLCGVPAVAQTQKIAVKLDMTKVPMKVVMNEIEKQTKYLFLYTDEIDTERIVSIKADSKPLNEVLPLLFKDTDITYEITVPNIVLSKRVSAARPSAISGVVKDSGGLGIIGATVLIKGTTVGTTTGIDGDFTLTLPASVDNPELSVSFIGYETRVVPIGSRTTFDITLSNSSIEVEQVVVTALGIKRAEKALSYNVQQVDADAVIANKDVNFINSLNGKVAGVNINASSAGMGGASKVVMRGTKSISQSSNALYVIDGVPMFTKAMDGGTEFASQGTTDPIADINPEDIESISVLTGAAAAALYGSDAANGAIVVTTKKGQVGQLSVTATAGVEIMSPLVLPEFQNRYGTGNLTTPINVASYSWGKRLNRANRYGYDPREDYFRAGVVNSESVSLSTGTEKNQTYFSAAAINSDGIVPNNSYDRYNFTFRNTTSFLNDKMRLDVGASYVLQEDCNMINQGTYNNPLTGAYLFPRGDDWADIEMYERYDPIDKISKQYWPMGDGSITMQNPYWANYRNLRENRKDRYMLNAALSYDILDWLNVSGRIRLDNSHNTYTEKMYASSNVQLTEQSANGLYGVTKTMDRQVYGDALLNINKTFGDDWSLQANIGASFSDMKNDALKIRGPIADGTSGEKQGLANVFNIQNLSNSTKTVRKQEGWREQTQSIFASAEVGYKGTYYLTLTGRNDWPSQLAGPHSNAKSFFYPSVGLSAVVSEMVDMPEWFSFLKVRGSYSAVGSSYAAYLTKPYYDYKGQTHEWDSLHRFPNENLKPEKTKSWEVGLNARFFGGKLNFDATWYRSDTFNQTFESTPSSTSGYSSVLVQAGQVRNSGLEMLLNYHNTWRDFTWNTSVTYTMNRNKIIRLANGVISPVDGQPIEMPYLEKATLGDAGSPQVILYEGGTMGDLYINRELRTDLNGNIYVDPQTNKVELTTTERRKVASLLPKGNIGWSNSFAWKGLNLNVMFAARLGGSVVSNTEAFLDYYGVSERSAAAREAGGVRINNGMVDAQNYYQTIGAGTGAGAYYIYDATNVRMQELSLAYTLPKRWFRQKMAMTVSLVGRNLWMIYNKAPFDPELTPSTADNFLQGVDYFMLPSLRNIGFTVKLQF